MGLVEMSCFIRSSLHYLVISYESLTLLSQFIIDELYIEVWMISLYEITCSHASVGVILHDGGLCSQKTSYIFVHYISEFLLSLNATILTPHFPE